MAWWVLRHADASRSFCMVLQVEFSCFFSGNHLVTLEKKSLVSLCSFFQLCHRNISMLLYSYFYWNSPEYDLESWKDIQFRSNNLKNKVRVWIDGWVVKSTYSFCRRSRLSSQNPVGNSLWSAIPSPGFLFPSSGLQPYCTHMVYIQTCTQNTQTQKIKINL